MSKRDKCACGEVKWSTSNFCTACKRTRRKALGELSQTPIVEWCLAETQRLRALGLDHILVLPVPPSANAIWRRKRSGGMFKISEAKLYEVQVAAIMAFFKTKPIKGPVALSLMWFRQKRQGDLTNRIKSLEDAIKGTMFDDDKEVTAIRVERVEGAPVAHVRVMAYKWQPRIFPEWQDSFPMTEEELA
jgi:Holliday junction resolvase RusA-like endonuclease